jgi:hypothetical protein
VVVHVDVQEAAGKKSLENAGGAELYGRLGGADGGVPFIAFLDGRGDLIVNGNAPRAGSKGGNIGHPFEPHEVDWFMSMLSKAAPGMTAAERAALEKPLRAQKK